MRQGLLFLGMLVAGWAIATAASAPQSSLARAAATSSSQINAPVNTMLHVGSHGRRVKDLQWLLGGHKPNTFTAVKATFHGKPNGYFGVHTAEAVKKFKWSLGYPGRLIKPVAGPYFLRLLVGKEHRPIRWIELAANRIREAANGPSLMAIRIRSVELSQVGVTEVPIGSNRGAVVELYQRVTGAIGLAWCVSFQQWSFLAARYGTFANDSAAVYYVVDWAQAHGLLRARPKVGALVTFIDYNAYGHRVPGSGHIGYVVKAGSGWFVSTEGNEANGVHEVFHRTHDRGAVFVYLPGVAS